jgi:hypothetical protein
VTGSLCAWSVRIFSPDRTFQKMTDSSQPPVTRTLPFGLKVMQRTCEVWERRVRRMVACETTGEGEGVGGGQARLISNREDV